MPLRACARTLASWAGLSCSDSSACLGVRLAGLDVVNRACRARESCARGASMSELRCSRVRGPGFTALAWVHGVIVSKSCTRGCPCMRNCVYAKKREGSGGACMLVQVERV
jgi:hypothetical protein